jgi:LppX_LprAFG lipoprotein
MNVATLTRAYRIVTIAAIITCSFVGSAGPSRATAVVNPAVDTLASASKRLAETTSLQFDLDVEGDTYLDTTRSLRLLEATGSLVRPNRVQSEFKIDVLEAVTISTSLIIIGDEVWSTDLITGAWGPAPVEFGYDPGVLFDLQNGIGPVMDRVQVPQQLADEEIDDRAVYHVLAIVDPEALADITFNSLTGNPVTVDLWIDRETFDLLRVRLAEPETVTDRAPAVWTLNFRNHGAALTIEPPD